MRQNPSFRDVEKLSAYLDQQLSSSDRARLEARLGSEPSLWEILTDMRQARTLMKKTPVQRVPHNFYLTPKMVGIRPPLPRSVPVFRFASITAAIVLFFTFAVNFLNPIAAAPSLAAVPYGKGGGCESTVPGNCGDNTQNFQPGTGYGGGPQETATSPAITAMSIAPQTPGTTTPEPTPQPGLRSMEQPTEAASILPTAEPVMGKPAGEKSEIQPLFSGLQIALITLFLIFGAIALIIRRITITKWQKRQ